MARSIADFWLLDQVVDTDDREGCLQLIREHLSGLAVRGDSAADAVNVIRVQNLEVLERPYNYIIGMSAKQFAADTTESPVLSDEELKGYLKGLNVLASDAGKRLRENLERTILTLDAGKVVMGYSTFDTIELKEGSPSVFYLDYLEKSGGKIMQIGNQPFRTLHGSIRISEESVREQVSRGWIGDAPSVISGKEAISMSSSALQMLVKCPIEYYYKYVMNLPGRDFQKKNASAWMNAAEKGNLFHWTMEEYCNCMLQGKLLEFGTADKAIFTEIFDKKVEEMLLVQPYVSKVVFEKEREESRETAWEYLKDFQQELYQAQQGEKKWHILGSELSFSDIRYTVKDPEGVHPDLIIAFNGSIDRLDGYVGEKGLLFLRITDYKTGRRKYKEEEIKNEHQLQHHVYAMAALQYVKDNREALSQLFGVQITYPVVECIQYVFPYELKKDQVIDTTKKVYECIREMRVELPESVNETLWNTLGYMNCGKEPLARSYMESYLRDIEEKLKKEFEKKGPCKYCDYHRQCRRKVGTDL